MTDFLRRMEVVSSERSETATDTINRELELLANVFVLGTVAR